MTIGYLIVFFVCILGAIKGYCGKKVSAVAVGYRNSLLATTLRMVLCAITGFLFSVLTEGFSCLTVSKETLLCALFAAFAMDTCVLTWLEAVRNDSYMMISVFEMLSSVIPIALCGILYGEAVRPIQWVGTALLVAATVIMLSFSADTFGKLKASSFIMPILFCLTNGLHLFSSRLFIYAGTSDTNAAFNLYTYVFAALLAWLFLLFINHASDGKTDDRPMIKRIFIPVLIMAIALFFSSFLQTEASKLLLSAQMYPFKQGVALLMSIAMSVLFFGEKLTKKSVIGSIMAFAGLLMVNVL